MSDKSTFTIGAELTEEDDKSCDWHDCVKNFGKHEFKIEYGNKGNVLRYGTIVDGKVIKYDGGWTRHNVNLPDSLGLTPNDKGSITIGDPRKRKNKNGVRVQCEGHPNPTEWENFPIQYHHVIPIKVMDSIDSLKHNLVLIDWDINQVYNGICMPYNYEDIARYKLQAHRSRHKKYSDNVKKSLNELEKIYKHFCKDDSMDDLLEQINKKVNEYRLNLIRGDWILHSKSKTYLRALNVIA